MTKGYLSSDPPAFPSGPWSCLHIESALKEEVFLHSSQLPDGDIEAQGGEGTSSSSHRMDREGDCRTPRLVLLALHQARFQGVTVIGPEGGAQAWCLGLLGPHNNIQQTGWLQHQTLIFSWFWRFEAQHQGHVIFPLYSFFLKRC